MQAITVPSRLCFNMADVWWRKIDMGVTFLVPITCSGPVNLRRQFSCKILSCEGIAVAISVLGLQAIELNGHDCRKRWPPPQPAEGKQFQTPAI